MDALTHGAGQGAGARDPRVCRSRRPAVDTDFVPGREPRAAAARSRKSHAARATSPRADDVARATVLACVTHLGSADGHRACIGGRGPAPLTARCAYQGRRTMQELKFYIDGGWVDPGRAVHPGRRQPGARRKPSRRSAWAPAQDVDRAATAARRAFRERTPKRASPTVAPDPSERSSRASGRACRNWRGMMTLENGRAHHVRDRAAGDRGALSTSRKRRACSALVPVRGAAGERQSSAASRSASAGWSRRGTGR